MKNLNSLLKNNQKQLEGKYIVFFALLLLSIKSYSQKDFNQISPVGNYDFFVGQDTKKEKASYPYNNFAFVIGDSNRPQAKSNFSWWANGDSSIGNLMMSLVAYRTPVDHYALSMKGVLYVQNYSNKEAIWDNLKLSVNGSKSYIESNGDEDGMFISSNTGNKISLGDNNDEVAINAKKLILDYGGTNDLAQVAINAGNPVNGAALTVGGMTYIGNSKSIESNPGISNDLKEDCSLFVEKQILASDLNIIPKQYWMDSVFESDYKKMDLNALEGYIKENKHLPGIVSEKEVKEKGYKIHAFNAGLLQNVEELLLHIIDQNKKIEVLTRKIEVLESQSSQHK